MANPNAAFGLLPIGKVGQNRDNQGLSEYGIAANASAIYQNDPVTALAAGTIGVVSTTDVAILGSLNGVFFTNASTKKPTWANNLAASNTATDIVGYVSDDPYERYEIQATSTLPFADIFLNGNIKYTAGSSANYVSKVEINTTTLVTTAATQLRIIGVSKNNTNNELLNATTYATNVVVTAIVNNHFYKQLSGI
jgi:hypothetical protein